MKFGYARVSTDEIRTPLCKSCNLDRSTLGSGLQTTYLADAASIRSGRFFESVHYDQVYWHLGSLSQFEPQLFLQGDEEVGGAA
jgi:hypothetical protein